MATTFDDADLGEFHVMATHAREAGFNRVEIDPEHVIAMVEELLVWRGITRQQHPRQNSDTDGMP